MRWRDSAVAWSQAQIWPRAMAESGSVARDTFLEAPIPQEDEGASTSLPAS